MDSSNCECIERPMTDFRLTCKNVYGFSFVKNCPVDPKATQELLEKIGPIRETQYGMETVRGS